MTWTEDEVEGDAYHNKTNQDTDPLAAGGRFYKHREKKGQCHTIAHAHLHANRMGYALRPFTH